MTSRLMLLLVVCAGLVTRVSAQDELKSPLGRLVDIGGRRLHLHCTGSDDVRVEVGPPN